MKMMTTTKYIIENVTEGEWRLSSVTTTDFGGEVKNFIAQGEKRKISLILSKLLR